MKKVIMLMVVLFTTVGAYAQFEKGKWYANASLTGLGLSHSKYEGTKFGFSMNGGAFVADNVAILLNFKGNYVEHGMDATTIGAQSRYYFASCGVYGGLGMSYKYLSGASEKENIYCRTRLCILSREKYNGRTCYLL